MRGLLLWLCSHFRSTTYPPFSFLTEKGGYKEPLPDAVDAMMVWILVGVMVWLEAANSDNGHSACEMAQAAFTRPM